jgi:cobalt-zinc-cadmium efflux system outer membrane protein
MYRSPGILLLKGSSIVKGRSVVGSLGLFFACTTIGWGQEERLRLDDLVTEALRNNPEVLAAQKRYEAARQRPAQESSLPDPMLSLGYTSVGSPRPFAGIGVEPTANAGLMVSQEFPFPGKRKLRGDVARKEAGADFELYQATQLNVVSRLKQAYYRLYYAYAARDVLERNKELLRKLLRITEARYSVGRAAQQDIFKAQTELSILETRLVNLAREREAREAELNSLLNRPPGSPLARPAEVQPKDTIIALEELYAAARENSPMLRRDQKMIERTELALNLARKDYYPDYVLSGGYFNQAGMADMWQFRVDFKLPAYFWRKQRAAVTERAQSLSQSRRTYESTNQALHFRIKDDYLMATTSNRLMKLYGQTVIPQASLALESSLATYETGTVDFLSVLTNYVTVVEYEMNYYEELQNYYVALSRLEEMTGLPLTR